MEIQAHNTSSHISEERRFRSVATYPLNKKDGAGTMCCWWVAAGTGQEARSRQHHTELSVHLLCVCVRVNVYAYVRHVSDCPCVPVWRPRVNVQCLTLLHSTLVFKGGARTEPRVPYLS